MGAAVGVPAGGKIRLSGKGEPGIHGGPPGDLILTVHVRSHPVLRREGDDLHLTLPITVPEAIADEWVPIKPGTDGALLLAIIHEIISLGLYDREFLLHYTNSPDLVNADDDSDDFGLFLRSDKEVKDQADRLIAELKEIKKKAMRRFRENKRRRASSLAV